MSWRGACTAYASMRLGIGLILLFLSACGRSSLLDDSPLGTRGRGSDVPPDLDGALEAGPVAQPPEAGVDGPDADARDATPPAVARKIYDASNASFLGVNA